MLMLLFHAEGFVRATLCGRIFILYCVESLTSLVEKMERRDNFHGIKVARGAPIISHLLFADDCFMFFRASSQEADHMKFILNMYETTSGQTLNLQKSEAYFSGNVDQSTRQDILSHIRVREG
ncbi:hypothetical protein AAZX31_01G111300 [Glycine max]